MATAALGIAAVVGFSHPLEQTYPAHRELAAQLRAGEAPSDFTPLGYAWLIALLPIDSLDLAAQALHVVCYGALVAVVCTWLVRTRQSQAALAIAASSWILFNPYVMVNLHRMTDTNVTMVAIVALFVLAQLAAGPAGATPLACAAAGALLAGLMFVRPNAITLSAALVFAAWPRHDASTAAPRLLAPVAMGGVACVATYVILSLVVAGELLFIPRNGAYNVFAGNNPAAYSAIALHYNAEPSLPEGLAWCGVDRPIAGVAEQQLSECARRFARAMPLEAVRVTAFKVYNLLWRPNLRLAESSMDVAVQYAMVMPAVVWSLSSVAVFIRLRRIMDPLATAFVAAFTLPFALGNSDPRFRLALDPVFALSLCGPSTIAILRSAVVPRGKSSTS
jgi:hypothetical protein